MTRVRYFATAAALLVASCWLASPNRVATGGEHEATGQVALPRGRAAAMLTALFHHDPVSGGDTGSSFNNNGIAANNRQRPMRLASATPKQAESSEERGKMLAFARSLVYEGGFFPKEIYQLLGYGDVKTARFRSLTNQLDKASGKGPAPWEVAGRVGRSGISGASDHWTMAPGESGDAGISTPGTLAYLPALAVVYAAYPVDGQEAAAQLAILKDDDMRSAPAARTALSLLIRVLLADRHDKDGWLRGAAADSRDADTEHDIRAVRAKDWRYLRGEECAVGRLERPLYIWYRGNNYTDIMRDGKRMLRSREGLAYLASLAAATYGMESLPDEAAARGAIDLQLTDVVTDLYDLATGGAVLRVEPERD